VTQYTVICPVRDEKINISSMLERETRREKHLEDSRRKIEDSQTSR
jgi:hypothetical protein